MASRSFCLTISPSIRLRSVMSSTIPSPYSGRPASSRTTVAVNEVHTVLPLFVRQRCSAR